MQHVKSASGRVVCALTQEVQPRGAKGSASTGGGGLPLLLFSLAVVDDNIFSAV
jgi:hypothetical protein